MNRTGKILLPVSVGMTFSLLGSTTLAVVLPTHADEVGITLGLVGVLLSSARVVRLLVNGPMGLAYDRWPQRRLFIPALYLGVLATLLSATARGFWPFLVARMVWGLAWAGMWIGGTTIVANVTTERERGRWMGVYQMFYALGLALGMVGGGWLTDRMGFRAAMGIAAAAAALGGLPALFLLPETKHPAETETQTKARKGPLHYWRAIQNANRELWAINGLQWINAFVVNGILAATVPLLVEALLPSTGLALGVATATGILGTTRMGLSMATTPLVGTLSDRLGRRWPMILGVLAIGVFSTIMVGVNRPLVAFAGVVLGALAGAGVRTLLVTRTGDLASPEQRGAAIGLLNVSGDLGTAAGPMVAYALLSGLGLSGLYLGCAGLYGLATALALWFWSRERHPSPLS